MSQYRPGDFEPKWQKFWDEKKTYHASNPGESGFDPKKKSFYVLDMFPYPSGSGLHVGHARGYIGSDIVARRKRMEGFNVLHPMGWDAFGLPAEQYAIQTGQHPRLTTQKNADNFRRQLKLLGLSYDWDREIDTSSPQYYRWTQWLFLQLFKKGLVYQKEVPVWWCEDLKTVLANEEVINGRSERGNYPCVRKPLKQWVFKITAYAERLLEDLRLVDWPENVKKMQVDWIGRSEGAEIDFPIKGHPEKIRVFSTRPDTLFGVTALVLAPDHPWALKLTTPQQRAQVDAYRNSALSKSDRDRKAEVHQITAVFTGSYARHPLMENLEVPIYLADYVMVDYGTGAVMSVPAHDERDHRFAKSQGLKIQQVIEPGPNDKISSEAEDLHTGEGKLINSGPFTGLPSPQARQKITAALAQKGLGNKTITYKLKDWVFSRQRYWGEPFPLSIAPDGTLVPADENELPITLPEMKDFTPSADGSAPLARVPEWFNHTSHKMPGVVLKRVTDTMPGWAGSCWYYLRFMDPGNDKAPFSQEAVRYWNNVDLYIGGVSHAVMHLLYARFWHKVFYDLGLVPTPEPFQKLFNQGMVTAFAYKDSTGRLVTTDDVEAVATGWKRKSNGEPVERFVTKMAKSLKNVVNPDDVIAKHGCDTLRIFEMFMGPLNDEKPWTDEGIPGCERFLKRVWGLFVDEKDEIRATLLQEGATPTSPSHETLEKAWARCLKRVDESFLAFNFNTAVAAFMEFINAVYENQKNITRSQAENFLKALSPFCPHIAAELWSRLGHEDLVDSQPWPKVDPRYLVEDLFELVISVNGRPRKRAQVKKGTPGPDLEKIALDSLRDALSGKSVVKVIVVPDKLVNVVVK